MRLREWWQSWRTRNLLPVELKKQSVLKDLVPLYHRTQAGRAHKQHRPVLRYPRKHA